LIITSDEAGSESALNVQVELFINLHLILTRDRRPAVVPGIPEEMWLIILRIHSRKILVVAAGRIVMVCRFAPVFVNIEELRCESWAVTLSAIRDHTKLVSAT
jgi:hypothetical protein